MYNLTAVVDHLQATLGTTAEVGISLSREPELSRKTTSLVRLFYGSVRSDIAEETTSIAAVSFAAQPQFRIWELDLRIQCGVDTLPPLLHAVDSALSGWNPTDEYIPAQNIGFCLYSGAPLSFQHGVVTYALTYGLIMFEG